MNQMTSSEVFSRVPLRTPGCERLIEVKETREGRVVQITIQRDGKQRWALWIRPEAAQLVFGAVQWARSAKRSRCGCFRDGNVHIRVETGLYLDDRPGVFFRRVSEANEEDTIGPPVPIVGEEELSALERAVEWVTAA